MTSIITRAAKINVSKKTTSGAKFAKQNVVFSNDESSADDPALTMSVKDRMKMFQNFQPPMKKFNWVHLFESMLNPIKSTIE